jgi:hypothetical protein
VHEGSTRVPNEGRGKRGFQPGRFANMNGGNATWVTQFLPIRLRMWSSTAAVGQQLSFCPLAF